MCNLADVSLTDFQRTRAGELIISPKTSEAEWYRWLENIQDWCISRQLWWGHRCPAYFVRIEGQEENVRAQWFVQLPTLIPACRHKLRTERIGSLEEPSKRPQNGRRFLLPAPNSLSSRIPMFWTPGSRQAYGRSRS